MQKIILSSPTKTLQKIVTCDNSSNKEALVVLMHIENKLTTLQQRLQTAKSHYKTLSEVPHEELESLKQVVKLLDKANYQLI